MRWLLWTAIFFAGCAASSPNDPVTPDADVEVEVEAGWRLVFEGLPSAALAVWGSSEHGLWVCGADRGAGALLLRRDSSKSGEWRQLAPPGTGDLRAVYGVPGGAVYVAGERGRLLRYAPSAKVEALATPVDATLRAVWGDSDSEVWVAGGRVFPNGAGLLLRVDAGVVTAVELPSTVSATAALLGIWGSAGNDVWIVGEEGTVLGYDGERWGHEPLPGAPRLVAVHGWGRGEVVAVGGSPTGTIWERRDRRWSEVPVADLRRLNAVVTESGGAIAVGMIGELARRDPSGGWSTDEAAPQGKDWSSAFVDAEGQLWLAGGNLLSAAALDDGAVLCFGTSCGGVPSDGVGDVTGSPRDAGGSETLSGDVHGGGDFVLTIGALIEDAFVPIETGAQIEIVQGSQGGIHLEVAARIAVPTLGSPFVALWATTDIGEAQAGSVTVARFPMASAGGAFESGLVPIFFKANQASAYVGEPATPTAARVCVTIELASGHRGSDCRDVMLVDHMSRS